MVTRQATTKTGCHALLRLCAVTAAALGAIAMAGCSSSNTQPPTTTVTVTVSGISDAFTSSAKLPRPTIIDGSLLHKFASRIDQLDKNSEKCATITEPDWVCDFQRTDRSKLLDDMVTVVNLQYDKTRYQFVLDATARAKQFLDLALESGCDVDAKPRDRKPTECSAKLLLFDSNYRGIIEHLVLIDTK